MTKLNEDDFVERLMPYLHRGSAKGRDPCPDSESLVALGEGTLDDARSQHIRDHFAHCAACTEIHKRLLPFESDVQPPQLEWQNAEKRLGNWIDSLLQEEMRPMQQIHKAGFWQKLKRLTAFQTVRYGTVGVVITLAVAAGVTMMTSHRISSAPEPSPVAAVQAPPATAAAAAPSPVPKEQQEQLDVFQQNQPDILYPNNAVLTEGESAPKAVHVLSIPSWTMRIEPGTRVQVRIAAVNQEPDGSFTFRGLLTKPLRKQSRELFPVGTLVEGRGASSLKELTIQTLGLPGDVQLLVSEPGPEQHFRGAHLQPSETAPTRFLLQGSPANVTISGKPGFEALSKGKTVEFQFVLSSKYQIQTSP
jgi:hypothetical protein